MSEKILFIPPTEFWLTHRDRETGASYPELLTSDDFLACHVVRVPPGGASANGSTASTHNGAQAQAQSLKEARGKAKLLTTINGRTIVVKDSSVYTNRGFKTHTQAHILYDALYRQDHPDSPQWLIYYISKPLVGAPELLSLGATKRSSETDTAPNGRQALKDIRTYGELLSFFPVIARDISPRFDQLFKQYALEAEEAAIQRATQASISDDTISEATTTVVPIRPTHSRSSSRSSMRSNALSKYVSSEAASEEQALRRSTEDLIFSAISIFQALDPQKLAMLADSTSLTGHKIEQLIERHALERFHESVLFPRLSTMLAKEDNYLESCIKPTVDIDLSQVGLTIDSTQHRKQLSVRVVKAVEIFRRMNGAQSPVDMIDILLDTQKCLTSAVSSIDDAADVAAGEKAMSADMLVSLLLVVVIRAPVTALQARLAYMRDFVFVTDVDVGETGYALSTFEAVLEYLKHNSGGLRKAARLNRQLWIAVRQGDLKSVKSLLEPDTSAVADTDEPLVESLMPYSEAGSKGDVSLTNDDRETFESQPQANGLSHVFPFLAQREQHTDSPPQQKLKKRVSMEVRSMSVSSARSYMSGTSTLASALGHTQAETTPEKLALTEDSSGKSVVMLAVESGAVTVLSYLLQVDGLYTTESLLDMSDKDGTTLFMAAVQQGDQHLVHTLYNDFIMTLNNEHLERYLTRIDSQGRSVAHYLFNAPFLIQRMGPLLPWQLRDKHGQTPLMAICRSYDHESYSTMVEAALAAAFQHQDDGEALHLDQHVDNKGNTLLHVVNDPHVTKMLLYYCDTDPNAKNEKMFTPLMTASRYGRTETIRCLFADPRTDPLARDQRGQTAVELAKDDEVRNRIESILLGFVKPDASRRRTAVVRAHLFDEQHVRLVLKSMSPSMAAACRRTIQDVDDISRWLAIEHPASWMPFESSARSPFQVTPRPSKAVLRDLRWRYDRMLRLLIGHPTFGNHETLWEFVLVEEITMEVFAERTQLKASNRVDKLREDYDPLSPAAFGELQLFVSHAHGQLLSVHKAIRHLYRKINNMRNVTTDFCDATNLMYTQFASIVAFVPPEYGRALLKYSRSLQQTEYSPQTDLHYSVGSLLASTSAVLRSLDRPSQLIANLGQLSEQLSKQLVVANKTYRLPSGFGLLEDMRAREQLTNRDRVEKTRSEMTNLGRELRYTQQTVASELAAWQASHTDTVKQDLMAFARRTLVAERERLENMRRALRFIRDGRTKKSYLL